MSIGPATYLWLDLEFTDLDPTRSKLVEIATIITDSQMVEIAKGPNMVIHQPSSVTENLNHWCAEHFAESGLLAEISKSNTTVEEAADATLKFVKQYFMPQAAILAGNSVYVDRELLAFHMPQLYNYVDYRIVDVNTVKELAHHWYPNLERYKKVETHRAKFDIFESIEELKYYQQQIFKRPK